MNTSTNQLPQRNELLTWQHGAIFLLSYLVIISRQPDGVVHAQFWAEGGHVFYAEAYNLGWWPPLFRTLTGYFQTLPRLSASLTLLVPFSWAPLLLNLIAIGIQALPVNLLLASRSSAWGSLRFRGLLAGMLLALPNCFEVIARIPNTQWLLGLSALVLLVASVPRSVMGRLFDSCVMLLCGLSGPFCIFLLPISIFLAWKHRDRWRLVPASIFSVTCIVQTRALLFLDPAARSHMALGASWPLFIRILGGQIYLGTLLGGNGLSAMPGMGHFILLAVAVVGGTAIMSICFLRSNLELKIFQLFTAMLLIASLMSPAAVVPVGSTCWKELSDAPGIRYWFLPTLAFAWSLLWSLRQSNPILRGVSAVLLCVMIFGIVRDWRNPEFLDTNFQEYAKRFEAAPAGTTVTIPISPEGWNMKLIKHPPR
jgi:hypothetical protein